MYQEDHNAPPINPLPPVVVVVSLAIIAVELLFQAAENGFIGGAQGIGWRLEAVAQFAFFDTVFSWMIETGRFPVEHLIRFVTYNFIHGDFMHAAFAVVMLLAIGKMVAEVFSQITFLVIFFASSFVGAVVYAVVLDTKIPLIGSFSAVYGMIGALTFMLWVRAKVQGSNQFRAFSLILVLMGLQLFFKLVFGGGNDWIADIAGFLTGFALSIVLAPDGSEGIVSWLDRIRRRR